MFQLEGTTVSGGFYDALGGRDDEHLVARATQCLGLSVVLITIGVVVVGAFVGR